MNVRNSLIFSLTFLFLLLFPTIGLAEKGATQGGGNEKAAEKNVVVPKMDLNKDVHTGSRKAENTRNENASPTYNRNESQQPEKGKKPEIHVPQKERQHDTRPESSKKLPAQANEKAKEARLAKAEKRQVSNPTQPIHKMSESKKPSEVVEKNVGLEPENKVQMEQLKDSSANRLDDSSEKSLKSSGVDTATVEDNGYIPLEDLPEHFPESESPDLFISQTKPSGSNAKGHSYDQKVSSKSIFDLIACSLEEIRVNFLQPYVMRQHIYRDQWVNAPPAPPPENALFF
ncbi:hypothetical protein AB685_00530 [Bacillus sp. LL01]|uniref:hypothetical protein n=1 Tax=Bacillus sp. LL01 TaxID=1665556 RepID=UPI00064D3CE3|nr:hypothetical protein [Bacillus sp. LL01]KMJ59410.1 hypothetical protein AB685_00530 [Bacillus sp. LL01]